MSSQEVDISGSGSYHASDLTSREAEVQVSGARQAEVRATESLAATVSGSGEIRYWGTPGQLRESTSRAGTIEPAG